MNRTLVKQDILKIICFNVHSYLYKSLTRNKKLYIFEVTENMVKLEWHNFWPAHVAPEFVQFVQISF